MEKDFLNRNYLVVGCGGLGCWLVEGLLRLGVKKIVVCDPDTFSPGNLNRQLYSSLKNIGKKKIETAQTRAEDLGYKGEFTAYSAFFEKYMLDGIDVVFDALDSIKDRLYLEDCCKAKNIPIIHGAVEGNAYQVGVCLPGKDLLHNIYKGATETANKQTNVITVMTCTSKQLALAAGDLKEYFEINEIP